MAGKAGGRKKKANAIDMKAGSLAYNRLDMQASQVLHMAIKLYPNLNYLLVLDHYDDITLFDSDVSPETVSYYQMKTSEDAISIDTAISETWLTKLYEHLTDPEWIVTELGLITNSPLKVTVKFVGEDEKKHQEEKTFSSEKTEFSEFNSIAVDKIKKDISSRMGIPLEDVDLSKFVHMRTTLSIPKHREIVEQEMGDFLQNTYPRITIDSVKTIYAAMMDLLTRRQSYELLDKKAPFHTVREKKGVSKSEFTRIIDETMLISVPQFQEIERAMSCSEDEKYRLSYEYTTMLADFQSKSQSFTDMFLKTRHMCLENPQMEDESIKAYCERIYNLFTVPNPIYNKPYISVLVVSVLINEWRRS